MIIDIITGFPDIVEQPLNQSIIKRARDKQAAEIVVHNLRDYTTDRHKTIDDYPYGGGPGMVLKVEPFYKCLNKILDERKTNPEIFILSPRGEKFNQRQAEKLSQNEHIILLCGHYKGIDERIKKFFDVKEISIGDYVLSSGEIAALVVVDSITRLLPGVISDINSAWSDSFSEQLLDAPYYTRPDVFNGKKVPDVLLTGNHEKIEQWRLKEREHATKKIRPDLYKKYLKINKID